MKNKGNSNILDIQKVKGLVSKIDQDLVTSLEEIVLELSNGKSNINLENVLELQGGKIKSDSINVNKDNFGQRVKNLVFENKDNKNIETKSSFGVKIKELLSPKNLIEVQETETEIETIIEGFNSSINNETITSDLFPEYELVFRDEFNSDRLDYSSWNTQYYYGSRTNIFNNEEQYYTDDAFEFNDGVLSIVGQQESIEAYESVDKYLLGQAERDLTFDYTSGMLSGHDKVAFTYGYMEIRAQVPQGQGLWPAFWMLPTSGEWTAEIDIMEILGHETDVAYQTLHYQDENSQHNMTGGYFYEEGIDFSDGFHTFGAEWNAEGITWYIDDQEIFTLEDNIPTESMYLLANLAIGGYWPGETTTGTPDYSTFDIDYIRVYQDSAATLHGGLGDDDLSRQNGNLAGEAGDDLLLLSGTGLLDGGIGNDVLTGGTGNNTLNGGDGNDILQDGNGIDTFTGGAGRDRFILGTNSNLNYTLEGDSDRAVITDFNVVEDVIQLTMNSNRYLLGVANNNSEIYLDLNSDLILDNNDELIAVIQNTNNLDLAQNYFAFI